MNKSFVLAFLLATALSLQIAHKAAFVSHEAALDLAALRASELSRHNAKRALHGTPNLTLSDSLNSAAQTYADYLATNHVFTHSPAAKNGTYGENLYWAWGYPSYTYKDGAATESWYA